MNLTEEQPLNFAAKEIDPIAQLHEQLELASTLLSNIKQQLPRLDELLTQIESHWGMEDGLYRFYHQSFKVYHLQQTTEKIHQVLQTLMPDRTMNQWFCKIITEGTGHTFEMSHNQDWLLHTRPVVEAFFHAHFFLKMAVKYGRELQSAPNSLPSGWAAVLYLFNLR